MKNKQGFIAGMDQDTANNKRNPASYYSMSNFRIITNEGLSSGSIETEKGTVLSFKIPNVPLMTSGGDTIPDQLNLKIVGMCTIVDDIIVFTTNETSATPNGYGQIWKLKYNETTNTIDDIGTGDYLKTTSHLIYNNKVDFSTYYRIKSIGRYENSNTARVYWTDNYNAVRVLNTSDPNSIDIPVDNLSLKPGVDFAQPNILSIGTGSLPTGSIVQFGYRLLDQGGAQTLYSPLSVLVPLVDSAYDVTNSLTIEGTAPNTGNNRSVTYNIKGVDTDFYSIEHIIVVYDDLNNKKIYKYKEDVIPSSGDITVTCDTISNAVEIPFVEFNILSSGFDIAKDIEVKNSRLIAANTKTKEFDINFDARVYRFNSASQALLEDSTLGNITLTGPSPLYTSVPEDHNCINKYNRESDANWHANNQYKYQVDGVTLGGSGLNISYKFTTQEITSGLTNVDTSITHITNPKFPANTTPLTLNVLDVDGNSKEVIVENQYDSTASQWYHSNYTGYFRGETYRFGIVFYNKTGSVSFVKWVGDIRFPDVTDGYQIHDTISGVNKLLALGIEFTVDISSVREEITGYSIVRVERKEEDKSKLGTGVQMFLMEHSEFDAYSLPHRWESTGPNLQPLANNNPYKIDREVELPGGSTVLAHHLSDRPGLGYATATPKISYLLSPLGQIYTVDFKDGDYVETRGYYGSYCYCYSVDDNSGPEDDREYGFHYKLFGFYSNDIGYERFQLRSVYNAQIGEYLPLGTFTGSPVPIVNAYASRKGAVSSANNRVPLGIGNRKLFLEAEPLPTITNVSNLATDLKYKGNLSNITDWVTTEVIEFGAGYTSLAPLFFKEIVYARYNNNQYGGSTYVARSVNTYIETNHFQVVNDNIPSSLTFDVYGGDTHVNYYDEEQIEQYWDKNSVPSQVYKDPGTNRLGVGTIIPCESSVNTTWRVGRRFAADRDGSNMGAYQSNSYKIHNLYRQENNTFEKFFAKDFLLKTTEEHPHQLWASETKIDGELVDSWRSFKVNNSTEVNGVYGPINRIITHKDKLFFYQNAAFGIASIDEKSVIQDESGQTLVLGTGGVFPSYSYISINTGAFHQYAVVQSEYGLYHYDARLKKVFRFNSEGLSPLSDVKKMSSLFYHNTGNIINSTDHTLSDLDAGGTGVHFIYDYKYNRILLTFLNNIDYKQVSDFLDDKTNTYTFITGQYVVFNGNIYLIIKDYTVSFPEGGVPNIPVLTQYFKKVINGFTITFNENLDAFESFYDYIPEQYLQYGRRLLSVDPDNKGNTYVMNVGEYGLYYENDYCNSTITNILCGDNDVIKIFNNLSYKSEVYSNLGVDIYDETFNNIRIYNEYQDSGLIPLNVASAIIPSSNGDIRRRMRTWRYTIPRSDYNARFRNGWLSVYLEYLNKDNNRLILHELEYSYTPSPN